MKKTYFFQKKTLTIMDKFEMRGDVPRKIHIGLRIDNLVG
jgi:hypothetical protein